LRGSRAKAHLKLIISTTFLIMNEILKTLTIQSNPKNVSRVEPFVDQLIQRFDISPDMYGNILISLTEAVNNAIIHGNSEDESKCVSIKTLKKTNNLAIQISDEGHGFDFQNLPDPTSPENLLKIGGRGVFLMKQLAHQVNFINNGSTVEIQFKL